jgi:AbiV family abortive infection protein
VANRKKAIERYDGKLSAAQVAHGMSAARRNAVRLYEDANLLLEAKRFPSACSLAILSIEESGKMSLLRLLATASTDKRIKDAWRSYRDHQVKNAQWIIAELAAKGAKKLDDLSGIFDPNSDHPAVLDVIKQLGFYTDCYGKAHWSEPFDVIEDRLAKHIVWTAKILLPKRETSEREVQLWIKHVGAHWGTRDMARGALEFEKAMIAEGLSDRTIEEVERFYSPETFKGVKAGDTP